MIFNAAEFNPERYKHSGSLIGSINETCGEVRGWLAWHIDPSDRPRPRLLHRIEPLRVSVESLILDHEMPSEVRDELTHIHIVCVDELANLNSFSFELYQDGYKTREATLQSVIGREVTAPFVIGSNVV